MEPNPQNWNDSETSSKMVQSDYSYQSSVTLMLDNLNWTTLEQRR